MNDEKKDAIAVRELPEPVARRGVTEAQWLTLCNSLFPGANPKSVINIFLRPEHHHIEPPAGSGGVSFPSIPTFKRFAMTVTIIATGTIVIGPQIVKPLQNVRLLLPRSI